MSIIHKIDAKNLSLSQFNEKTLDKSVKNIVQYLKKHNMKIATAESCTGGLLSTLITSVSGASDVFEIGICTYAEKMKTKFLNVCSEDIKKYNVVSYEVASQMANGLKDISDADICITTTGIAGPSGGTYDIPVGTVFEGFFYKNHVYAIKFSFCEEKELTREEVRKYAAYRAFEIAEGILTEKICLKEKR